MFVDERDDVDEKMKERVRVYDQIEHLERIETLDEK
jgi:hypothetical protein